MLNFLSTVLEGIPRICLTSDDILLVRIKDINLPDEKIEALRRDIMETIEHNKVLCFYGEEIDIAVLSVVKEKLDAEGGE